MAGSVALVYHGPMQKWEDILYRDEPMEATDWLVDAVVAVGAFGFACLQLTLSVNLLFPDEMLRSLLGIDAVVPTVYSVVAIALTTLPLIARRRFPWPTFVLSLVLWAFFQLQTGAVSLSLAGPLVALFTIAYELSRAHAIAGAVAAVLILVIVPSTASSATMASLSLLQNVAFVAAAAFAGYAIQVRQDYLRAAEERAAEAERTRETEAERRVAEERVRIAREVHDITAHSLSAVSIQAAAAERLIDSDPAAAKEAIATVRATSKGALDDIRAMIGVLRSGEGAAQTSPTESTEQIGALAAYLEGAGVSCELDTAHYDRTSVPAHVDVALFGIAREATTNVVRHAQARHVRIVLRTIAPAATSGMVAGSAAPAASAPVANVPAAAAPAAFAEIIVEDDGRGCSDAAAVAAAGGHGIEGMGERVRVLGGTFEAAPRAEGGFRVHAVVPLAAPQQTERNERTEAQ